MARLKLLDLRCIKSQESGGDEPYLLVDGEKVWKSEEMNSGEFVSLRSLDLIHFEDKIKVELMEKDSGMFNRDDKLGACMIRETGLGKDELDCEFDEDGAHYMLIYKVLD